MSDEQFESWAVVKMFTQCAIFSTTPCTEETARRAVASQFRSEAVTMVDMGTPRRCEGVQLDAAVDAAESLGL